MTHDKIKNLLFEKLDEIIPKDRREGIGIIIGTFDEYGDTTDNRVMNVLDDNLVIANTTMVQFKGNDKYSPAIIIFEDNLMEIEKQVDKQAFIDEIDITLKHEFWHCEQFRWLYEHGGLDALKRASDADLNAGYPNGVLERGAIDYSENGIIQDFEKTLSQFI